MAAKKKNRDKDDDDESILGGAFHWLTSPIEGAAAAREASMVFRNNQELRVLADLYGSDFIKWYTLENSAEVSMSWYVPGAELKCMTEELNSKHNKSQLKELGRFWSGIRPHDLDEGPDHD